MTKLIKEYKGTSINYYVDGKPQADLTKAELIDRIADVTAKDGTVTQGISGNGVQVEIYIDKYNKITDVVAIEQHPGEIYSITKADEKTGSDRYVTIKGGMTFETEDFAKKDIVVYTKAYTKTVEGTDVYEIKSMDAAEMITGTVTGKVAGKSIVLDGVTYKFDENYAESVNLGDKVEIYVDSFGYLLKNGDVIAAAASVDDYVVVTAAGKDSYKNSVFQVLKTDGTTASVAFEQYVDAEATELKNDSSLVDTAIDVGNMYTMEDADSDGKFEFYAPNLDKVNDKYAGFDTYASTGELNPTDDNLAVSAVNGEVGVDTWNIADDAVVFVEKMKWVENEETGEPELVSKEEWTVTTGSKLAAADKADVVYAFANKATTGFKAVEFAYVKSTMSSSSDILYGYVTADPMEVKNADGETVKQITFWNGEESVTMLTDKANASKLAKKAFFTYKVNADGEMTSIDFAPLTTAAVTGFNGEKIAFAAADKTAIGTYELSDDVVIIYVDAGEVAADNKIALADQNDDETAYILNVKYDLDDEGKKVIAIFVDAMNDIADVIK